jgi:hypothetical protein
MQLNTIQQQYRDALKASMKIQEASQEAMHQRFKSMESGASQGPTHAEEIAASLKQLLLDEDSDDHKLLVQVFRFGFFCNAFFHLKPAYAVSESHKQESCS